MKKLIFILLLLTGCYRGTYTHGYLVSVQNGIDTQIEKFESQVEAEVFINKYINFYFSFDKYMGNTSPYFYFENDKVNVYVELKNFKTKKLKR